MSMSRIILFATAASLLVAGAAPAAAPQFDTPAKVAYLIDLSSGAVLYAKNADVRMPPASMAKMMTTDVAFELIDKRPAAAQQDVHGAAGNLAEMAWPGGRIDHVPVAQRAGQRRESAQGHRHSVGQ